MGFVHLHVHSEFSALDGMVRLGAAFKKAGADGQNALAITDHGTLGGIWKARKFAKDSGVKLIPGIEVYVAIGSRHERNSIVIPIESPLADDAACSHADSAGDHDHSGLEEAEERSAEKAARTAAAGARSVLNDPETSAAEKTEAKRVLDEAEAMLKSTVEYDPDAGDESDGVRKKHYWHMTLLARNEEGWKNLIAMQNEAFENGVYYKPRIDFDLLKKHSEGIIVLTGCLGGIVAEPIGRRRDAKLRFFDVNAAIERRQAALDAEGVSYLTEDQMFDLRAKTEEAAFAAAELAMVDKFLASRYTELAASGGHAVEGDDDFVPALTDQQLETLRGRIDLQVEKLAEKDKHAHTFDDWRALVERNDRLQAVAAPAQEQLNKNDQALLTLYVQRAEAKDRNRTAHENLHANLNAVIDAVGKENVYVEVMEHGIESEQAILPDIVDIATEYGLNLVATNDSHYLEEKDHDSHEAWLAMQSKSTLADEKRYRFTGHGFFLRTEEQMLALREDAWWHDAVQNTQVVADRIEDDIIPDPSPRMPRFIMPTEETGTSREYFVKLINEGTAERFGSNWKTERPDVKERLNMEFGIIDSMGFGDYFLIVHDVISWARSTEPVRPGGPRKRSILVGPGRGSAAGSLISYVLRIVNVDPLRYGLLFERFLEPGRPDWPDIDMDFEKSRLDDVLAYMMHKWGVRSVARIGSFAVSKSRASIKSSARVQGIKGGAGDKLSKLVPVAFGQPWDIEKLYDESKAEGNDFRRLVAKLGDDGEKVMALAREFEGLVTGVGIHACGVVVADIALDELVPLRVDNSKVRGEQLSAVTAWDSKDIEAAGLLKLDFLSLRTLDIISLACANIRDTQGIELDPDDLPDPNDLTNPRVAAAYRLLTEGQTAGIFQSEGSGITKLYQNIQPSSLEDLSAVVALFRPGPLAAGMDVRYADRKHGREAVTYDYITTDKDEQAVISSILDVSYGSTVYQEQIMQLSRVVAGFDAKLANKMRKAMGKKLKDVMAEVEVLFIDGSTKDTTVLGEPKHAFKEITARKLWDLLKGNADYLFNKSHSVAYAYIAYVTAFLKASWPAEFGAAVLATTEKKESRVAAIRSLQAEGIEILPPSVNKSRPETSPDGARAVRLGLSEIKGVGDIGRTIYENRVYERADGTTVNDRFSSLNDLISRLSPMGLKVNNIEALIQAGACDCFHGDDHDHSKSGDNKRMGMYMVARALRESNKAVIPDIEWGPVEKAARQRAVLHTSLGEHPLRTVQAYIRDWRTPDAEMYGKKFFGQKPAPIAQVLRDAKDGDNTLVLGLVSAWSERAYGGGRMANVTLEGSAVSIDAVIWDSALTEVKAGNDGEAPRLGTIVTFSGRIVTNIIEVEDEEGNISDISKKEMYVTKVFPVDVPDEAIGTIPSSTFVLPEGATPVVVAAPEPEPVPDTLPGMDVDDYYGLFDAPPPPEDEPYEATPVVDYEGDPVLVLAPGMFSELKYVLPVTWLDVLPQFEEYKHQRMQDETFYPVTTMNGRVGIQVSKQMWKEGTRGLPYATEPDDIFG